ncbi:hypothetical protein QR90_06805 [Deinococcus radiopugnans]|uniref:Uncharacterized protein n=2 Tax=Deinococcus radiopugnans TaxID=57497 RepID=A0A0A7KK24_9DEIO|nr:hypothetical protein QR90_06805 [Deinococcus radiopugnans]
MVRIENLDQLPSAFLYDQSLSYLISRGYTIKTADKDSMLLVGEFYNTYTRATYPATIQIRPEGSDPRINFNFTLGMAPDYQRYMADAAAKYR